MSLEQVEFHGLPAMRLEARGGASAVVTVNGAQLVSWIPAGERERLFVSERSAFAPGRPVRGGVPVAFPQFSDRGPLPKHGLVRTRPWRLDRHDASEDGATATFAIEDDERSHGSWPHAFALELTVAIAAASLEVRLQVRNRGDEPFSFTAALHTYLSVLDARNARLEGLPGVRYLEGGKEGIEAREEIPAAGPIDNIYVDAPRTTRLLEAGRVLEIAQRNFRDTVVWNPGPGPSAALDDMGPDGYLRMLCVEAAAVASPIVLAPGMSWNGAQRLVATGADPL